jgi:hypothetical protein
VLHSWGQNLHFHPHLHCVVPGGGLSADGRRWISGRRRFLLPVTHLLHQAGGSSPFPIGCNFENDLVTRLLSS